MKTGFESTGERVSPARGIAIQRELSEKIVAEWDGRKVSLVAGADVHFPEKNRAAAAVVVIEFPSLETVEEVSFSAPCLMPYIPGLLSFREIPAVLGAWKKLSRSPDILLCDSHGIAHPRGFGMASHIGLVLGLPSIGCAKSHLYGSFEEPGLEKGDRSPVLAPDGRVIGSVLRTRARVRPVYVSTGHMIDLTTAIDIVLKCTMRFRIPEPLRRAHTLAGKLT